MNCDECEYKYLCFTTKDRPIKVKINWRISTTCQRCKHVTFGTETVRYTRKTKKVGLCTKHNLLVHQKSATCDDYEPKTTRDIDNVYNDLRQELGKKKNKLPKYCEADE